MKLFDVRSTLVLFWATIFVCKSAHWLETYRHAGWTLNGGYYMYTRHIEDCALQCVMKYDSYCKAVSFNKDTSSCVIGNASRINVFKGTEDKTLLIYKTTTLEALFVGKWYGSQYYYFDNSQAYDTCQIFKGRLMSGTELADRFSNGEHMCQCGWTMDGTPMYLNQGGNSSWACGGDPGVYSCNTTIAHAWCTMLYKK